MGSESHRVFKFRSGNENDLDSLFENYMWFSGLDNLNDPYEGYASFSSDGVDDEFRLRFLKAVYSKKPNESIPPEVEAQTYLDHYENDTGISFSDFVDSRAVKIVKEFYEEHKSECKILSLSLAKYEDPFPPPLNDMLMWSHYANGFKGFCIEFDFESLKSSIEEKNNIKLGCSIVDYANDGKLPVINLKTFMQSTIDDSKETSLEILKAFTRKEQSWTHENEVRLLSDHGGKLNFDPDCINAIYISERAPGWLKNILVNNVVQKESGIKVYLVFLHESEYKFGFRRIDA